MQNGADARVTRRRFDAALMAYTNVTVTSQITLATVHVLCDDDFEFPPDSTKDCGVSCPWASEKIPKDL